MLNVPVWKNIIGRKVEEEGFVLKKKEVYTQDRRWETGWPVDQDGLLFSGQLLLDHSAKEALGRECPLDSTLTH